MTRKRKQKNERGCTEKLREKRKGRMERRERIRKEKEMHRQTKENKKLCHEKRIEPVPPSSQKVFPLATRNCRLFN
jgi:hypothetical protein